jgi:hypothetical protein
MHKIGKNRPKMEIFDFFESLIFYCIRSNTVYDVFHDLKNVKIGQFLPILNHIK